MKLQFATDFHAAETCFRKFLNSAKFYGADALIGGGDMIGKMVIPIIEQANGHYEATYYGSTVHIRTQHDLEALQRNLRNAGFYSIITTPAALAKDTAADAERITTEQAKAVLKGWIDLADERLTAQGIPCVMMAGNDDPYYIDEIMASGTHVLDGAGKVVDIMGLEVLSVPQAIHSPFKYPRDVTEEEMATIIDNLAAQVKDMSTCIFNIHIPPYDTDCDVGTLYNDDLSPVVDGGELAMDHVGSKAVRAAIEKYQPLLSLHGHIHECQGVSQIGRTVCINPGSDYDQGTLRGALITIDQGKLDYTLTAG
ncbi:MAG: hypothetical protein FWF25_09025 [Propionibacteriaceae bacterium]|nr:hypothetical protein [Propionibacteriaceae bacterium]